MYCPNCGNEIESEALFCDACGYDLRNEMMPQTNSISGTEDDRMFRKEHRRLPVVLMLVALFVVAICGSVVLIARSNTPERRFQKQLDLGYRYLSELDYEQARATFEAAIKIDPKNPDGYHGLLDALVGLGDANGILLTLEKASANLEGQDVSNIRTTATHEISVMIDAAMAEKDYELAGQLNASLAKVDEDVAVIYEGLITQRTVAWEQIFEPERTKPEEVYSVGENGGAQLSDNESLLGSQLKKTDETADDKQIVESISENEPDSTVAIQTTEITIDGEIIIDEKWLDYTIWDKDWRQWTLDDLLETTIEKVDYFPRNGNEDALVRYFSDDSERATLCKLDDAIYLYDRQYCIILIHCGETEIFIEDRIIEYSNTPSSFVIDAYGTENFITAHPLLGMNIYQVIDEHSSQSITKIIKETVSDEWKKIDFLNGSIGSSIGYFTLETGDIFLDIYNSSTNVSVWLYARPDTEEIYQIAFHIK